jgi:hypothetical protein
MDSYFAELVELVDTIFAVYRKGKVFVRNFEKGVDNTKWS